MVEQKIKILNLISKLKQFFNLEFILKIYYNNK